MSMLQRLGSEHMQEIERYLRAHAQDNILVLSDLMSSNSTGRRWDDPLSCIAYHTEEGVMLCPLNRAFGNLGHQPMV